jgi:ribonuclease BN (tRNA processing enzyme)
MKIKCFGTAGYHPSEHRHTSCYYIPELSLLLDAGTGIFRLTAELLADPRESVDIWLSHAHLDHVVGLTFLLDTMAVTTLKRVRVFGEAAKLQAIRDLIYHDLIFPVEPTIEFIELPDSASPFLVSGYRDYSVQWLPLEHPGGAVGYVIEYAGKRLAYITDTTAYPDSQYIPALRDLDVLLHECNFGDEHQALAEKTGHSWLSAVVGVVERCRPTQTQLIHHNPLAELLNIEHHLTPAQLKLGMHLANDGDSIVF